MHTYILFAIAVMVLYLLTGRQREGLDNPPGKYALLGWTTFSGNDINPEGTSVKSTAECRAKCDGESVCKGFVVTRKKRPDGTMMCWTKLDEAIRPGNRVRDPSKNSYVKKDHWDYWKVKGLQSDGNVDLSSKACWDSATLFRHRDFGGDSEVVKCGVHSFNYLSSLKIPKSLKVRLMKPDGKGGTQYTDWWKSDVPYVGDDWNDKATAVEVAAR